MGLRGWGKSGCWEWAAPLGIQGIAHVRPTSYLRLCRTLHHRALHLQGKGAQFTPAHS